MTLCRRGRSVFRRTLVRGLVVMSVIGEHLPTTAQWTAHHFRTFATPPAISGEPPLMPRLPDRSTINDANRVARRPRLLPNQIHPTAPDLKRRTRPNPRSF